MEQCQADEKEETLLTLFNEQSTSDSVVQYLRLLTSTYLQNHADFFCNFVEAPCLKTYCKQVSNSVAALLCSRSANHFGCNYATITLFGKHCCTANRAMKSKMSLF